MSSVVAKGGGGRFARLSDYKKKKKLACSGYVGETKESRRRERKNK